MSKTLESVITRLGILSKKMNERATEWSIQSHGRELISSNFEAELKSLKLQLAKGAELNLSRFLQKQIFLNPSILAINELKIVLELTKNRFPILMSYLLRGWQADSELKGNYYSLLSDLARNDEHYSCPKWLEDWSNLRNGDTFINFISSRNINFTKIPSNEVPTGQLQKLIYTYELYKSNYRRDDFFDSIKVLTGKIPIISTIGHKSKNINIHNDLENILVVAAVLNCRLITKRSSEDYGNLDEILNQILLNPTVGDPRMNTVDTFWLRIAKFAPESFQDWLFELNREDFKFFFNQEILGQLNDDRVDFWSKYLGSMRRVQIILSPEIRETLVTRFGRNEEVMRTINRAKYYTRRSEYCTAIFYFDRHIFIENHKTGAACYYFSYPNFRAFDEKISRDAIGNYSSFTNHCDESLPHTPNLTWASSKFTPYLAKLGIYPNQSIFADVPTQQTKQAVTASKDSGVSSYKNTVNTPTPAKKSMSFTLAQDKVPKSVSLSDFIGELQKLGGNVIDERPKGKLWIVYDKKLESIVARMKSSGIRVLISRYGSFVTNNVKAWWVEDND